MSFESIDWNDAASDEKPRWLDIKAQLKQCVKCHEPLIITNGVVERPRNGRVVVWLVNENGETIPVITVHHQLCDAMKDGMTTYRGR